MTTYHTPTPHPPPTMTNDKPTARQMLTFWTLAVSVSWVVVGGLGYGVARVVGVA